LDGIVGLDEMYGWLEWIRWMKTMRWIGQIRWIGWRGLMDGFDEFVWIDMMGSMDWMDRLEDGLIETELIEAWQKLGADCRVEWLTEGEAD